jgi:hypothetical protein
VEDAAVRTDVDDGRHSAVDRILDPADAALDERTLEALEADELGDLGEGDAGHVGLAGVERELSMEACFP